MKNVLIAGSTGMIGGIILRKCLDLPEIQSVTTFVRKPTGLSHPKLIEVIHSDFADYANVADHFSGVDIGFFCIGVYTGQVPDAQFKTITVDYARAFADSLKQNSPDATLCFLSGAGADRKEKSSMSFAKYKGMAENYLLSKNFKSLYIFRPGYIYPVEKREEPNFSYKVMRWLYPLMKIVYSSGVITSEQLGEAMFRAGLSGAPKNTLENTEIKAVARPIP